RANPLVLQCRPGGVAEAEAADHDVEAAARELGEAEAGQRDLGGGEAARHQEVVAQLDLVDLGAARRLEAPPQGQRADRRRSIVEFFEEAHCRRFRSPWRIFRPPMAVPTCFARSPPLVKVRGPRGSRPTGSRAAVDGLYLAGLAHEPAPAAYMGDASWTAPQP